MIFATRKGGEEAGMKQQPPPRERLPGAITVETDGDRAVLRFAGEVDSAVVELFKQSHDRPSPIDAIEAGTVTFISSTGLAVMFLWWEASSASGRVPQLRHASATVQRVLRQAGLDITLLAPDHHS
jgi:anti-anti-sigma factor